MSIGGRGSRRILLLGLVIFHWLAYSGHHGSVSGSSHTPASYHVREGAKNEIFQQQKPYVLLISLDGFRFDYLDHKSVGTFLRWFRSQGSGADRLIPVFPSLTFPNHFSMATGLYPGHHRIVANRFYDSKFKANYRPGDMKIVGDGRWYEGVPLWSLAESQGMLAASFFWVGSDAEIHGSRPSYYYDFDKTLQPENRVRQLREWLAMKEENRPHFVTLYFPEVDSAGHIHGPESYQVDSAIDSLDRILEQIFRVVKESSLDINIIIVSDHGMLEVEPQNKIYLEDLIPEDLRGQVTYGEVGAIASIYSKDKDVITAIYQQVKERENHFTVYRSREVPDKYNLNNDDRLGDLFLVAEPPYLFQFKSPQFHLAHGGHGWAPDHSAEMHGIFMAWGPQIKSGIWVPSVRAVDVYPFVTQLLGLEAPANDGDQRVLEPILKK